MVGGVGSRFRGDPPRLGCGQKGQREAKPTSMQTGPLGPRWNRITENAENCDVCFNCFLEASLNPKKKWKTENSSPSLTWLWSEVLSAGKPEVTRLRPRAVRTGNCSGPSKEAGAVTASIRDIRSVAGLATGRWLVILLWGLG